jgi:hypothetical protein
MTRPPVAAISAAAASAAVSCRAFFAFKLWASWRRSAQFLALRRYIMLPSEIALIAYQSKSMFYDVLFRTAVEILPSGARPPGPKRWNSAGFWTSL